MSFKLMRGWGLFQEFWLNMQAMEDEKGGMRMMMMKEEEEEGLDEQVRNVAARESRCLQTELVSLCFFKLVVP